MSIGADGREDRLHSMLRHSYARKEQRLQTQLAESVREEWIQTMQSSIVQHAQMPTEQGSILLADGQDPRAAEMTSGRAGISMALPGLQHLRRKEVLVAEDSTVQRFAMIIMEAILLIRPNG